MKYCFEHNKVDHFDDKIESIRFHFYNLRRILLLFNVSEKSTWFCIRIDFVTTLLWHFPNSIEWTGNCDVIEKF